MEVRIIFKGYLKDLIGSDEVLLYFNDEHVKIVKVLEKLMNHFSILQHEFNNLKKYWNNPFLIFIQRNTEVFQASLDEEIVNGDQIIIIPIAVGGSEGHSFPNKTCNYTLENSNKMFSNKTSALHIKLL